MCKTANAALFTLVLITAWAAFGLGTSAVGSKTWLWTSTTFSGLWVVCTDKDTCALQNATAALNAVRAFVIMGIAFGFIGTIAYSSGFWKRTSTAAARAGYGFIYLGALCWTVAMIVYTVTYSFTSVAWGYSYAFGWGCVGLLNFAGGFAHASIHKQQQEVGDGGF